MDKGFVLGRILHGARVDVQDVHISGALWCYVLPVAVGDDGPAVCKALAIISLSAALWPHPMVTIITRTFVSRGKWIERVQAQVQPDLQCP